MHGNLEVSTDYSGTIHYLRRSEDNDKAKRINTKRKKK